MSEDAAGGLVREVRYGPSRTLPTRFKDERGKWRLAGRRPLWYLLKKCYCPNGHRIKYTFKLLQEDTLRCEHRGCGVLLFAICPPFPSHAHDGEMLLWAVEVTEDEIGELRPMNTIDRLLYLGQTWPGLPE